MLAIGFARAATCRASAHVAPAGALPGIHRHLFARLPAVQNLCKAAVSGGGEFWPVNLSGDSTEITPR